MLRGLIIKTEKNPGAYDIISDVSKARVRLELIAGLEVEQNDLCRSFICDLISELGANILADGQWPELLPFLFRWSKSEVPVQRESALMIFSTLAGMLGSRKREREKKIYFVLTEFSPSSRSSVATIFRSLI